MNTRTRTLVLTLLALLPALPADAQVPDRLKVSIPAPPVGVQNKTRFGTSVAVDGPYTVVAMPLAPIGAINSGAVKVFNTTSGALLHVLANPIPVENSDFGRRVSISGSRVAILGEKIYVYDLSSATPSAPIATLANPDPATFNFFGTALAISGTRVVVGTARVDEQLGDLDAGRVYVYDLASPTPNVPVTLLNDPAAGYHGFGLSAAISGARVVVGAYFDDTGAEDAGSAYVYDLDSAAPTAPVVTLHNPNPAVRDYFGAPVAISGTRVVVGASDDDTGAPDAGSAYVYDVGSGTPAVPVATFHNPSPAENDAFGSALAISGARVVVGARFDDTGAEDAGSAYVYDLGSATPAVPVATLNNPAALEYDDFGASVAISGTRVVIGVPGDFDTPIVTGNARIYDLSSATPAVPAFTLNDTGPSANDYFGLATAISGTRLVVGAASEIGSPYVYDLSSATPAVPVVSLNKTCESVAISGTLVVVGSPLDTTLGGDTGAVFVFDLGSSTPAVPIATLNAPDLGDSNHFGASVAISGTRVVVGTPHDNTGAPDAGTAYVYDIASATPALPIATLHNPRQMAHEGFAQSVAIAGTRVVVGAYLSRASVDLGGIAYVYDLVSATPAVPIFTLNNPNPVSGDHFGQALAISGTRVTVGAPGYSTSVESAGKVYVYDLSSAAPATPAVTFANPNPAIFSLFGFAVGISGTRVAVGAVGDGTGGAGVGRAYLYDLLSPTPTIPAATLNNPAPTPNDYFGWSVALDGTTVAVGAPGEDAVAVDKGYAYIFAPSPYSTWKATEAGDQFAPDLGDTDRDGLSNLGEYGLLRSPLIPDDAATTAAPALYPEGARLRMFVPRDPARNDITLEVQATGNLLGAWTTIATSTLGAPFTGPGYFSGDAATPGVKSVEVRDTVNLTDTPQRYLRVRMRH